MITQERLEHMVKHKKSLKHDVETYEVGDLANAAGALLEGDIVWMPKGWDPESAKKMFSKGYKERLAIAGSLIAAEIDRLNYTNG